MSRDWLLYLDDIVQSAEKICRYVNLIVELNRSAIRVENCPVFPIIRVSTLGGYHP